MARFPLKEAEIVALAEAMITGLTANAVLYPAPPVAVLDLTTAKTAYITALNTAIAAAAFGLWSFFLLLSPLNRFGFSPEFSLPIQIT